MATPKNTAALATSPRTKKARSNNAAHHDTAPVQTPVPAELVVAEATASASPATAEPLSTANPMPVPDQAAPQTQAEEPPPGQAVSLPIAPMTKLSALEAALRVLAESGQAMNCQELIAAMAAQGYWKSPKGRTPAGTLYSAVLREIQSRGDQARFRKTERGKFALRQNV